MAQLSATARQVDLLATVVLDDQFTVVAHRRSSSTSSLTASAMRVASSPSTRTTGEGARSAGAVTRRHPVASMTAARVSATRRAARTSWARRIRQPRLTPRAWAAMVAPGPLVGLETEQDPQEGLVGRREKQRPAQRGQTVGAAQQRRGLGRGLAQVESGVEDDTAVRNAGRRGPGRPDPLRKRPTSSTTSS